MNGLYGIWCKLCALFNVIGRLCDKVDAVIANNELICECINEIVGDPNAECLPCTEAEVGGAVANEQIRTEEVRVVTAQIQASAVALKAQFTKAAERAAETNR